MDAQTLAGGGFDEIVLATGVLPRMPAIEGVNHPKVLSYLDVLRDEKPVGGTVAVIGAGGIGFDVAEYLAEPHEPLSPEHFFKSWGVDPSYRTAGGAGQPQVERSARQVILLQRSKGKPGDKLGKTTGWIHRAALKARGVATAGDAVYRRIDGEGLHVTIGGEDKVIPADNVVICAGPGAPARSLRCTGRARLLRSSHRRGRCGGRTRREARHRSGNAARRGTLAPAGAGEPY